MGIPKLFRCVDLVTTINLFNIVFFIYRWISERYPLILSPADAFTCPDVGIEILFK